ncbi:hypothetical protein [Microbacterium terricola]|uniref:Ig-like domain-containing protein n=1 Tax=Microbacterium terricola TaxID=344163 RepID=A0ABM8E0K1_9MICO|nr:hypothetical protein [Microbacterium terricola]UYK40891.1 hypothetical protein OAU46_04380 [Microbacterium terricola]BDV31359.1 hypothetical protein Microterr_20190 [Microbacterium terricola]
MHEAPAVRTPVAARRSRRRRVASGAGVAAATALVLSLLGAAPAQAADEIAPPTDPLVFAGDTSYVGDTIEIPSVGWTPAEGLAFDVVWVVDDTELTFAEDDPEAVDPLDLTLLPEWAGSSVAATVHASAGDVSASFTVSEVTVALPPVSLGTPTLSAPPTVDAPVAAVIPGAESGDDIAYSWLIAAAVVGTQPTFTPAPEQLGQSLSVTVSVSRDGFETAQATSAAATIGAAAFTTAPAPLVSGAVRVASKLTAVPGTWAPGATFTYAWKLDGTTAGTASTFTPASTARGKKLTLSVTGTRPGYTKVTKTTPAVTVGYGVFTAPTPKISGTPVIGGTLKASVGTWSPAPSTVTYRWLRDGAAIKGATKSSYTLTAGDWKTKISVKVTGARTAWATKSVVSAAVIAVKPFTVVKAPTISGTTRVGSTLTAKVAPWTPTATFTYQWKRAGVSIPGATKSTYKLVAADYRKAITVTVTGTRSGYLTRAVTSKATAAIAAPAPIITADGAYTIGTANKNATATTPGTIKPGTYVTTATDQCVWFRGEPGDADPLGFGWTREGTRMIVTITSADPGFETYGCGGWAPYYGLGTPASSFGDGAHAVGVHVKPGLYEMGGDATICYWETFSDFSGSDGALLGMADEDAPVTTLRIGGDVRMVFSQDCGTWTRIGD